MLESIKNPFISTKKFVIRHKVAIAVAGTAAFLLYMDVMLVSEHNEFLKEHDLIGEFAKFTYQKK